MPQAPESVPQKLYEYPADPKWEGRRLKDVLKELGPTLTSRSLMLAVKNGLVRRGGETLPDLDVVLTAGGEPLQLDLRHGIRGRGTPDKKPLVERMRVVFEDEHLIVVDKAAGIMVAPGADDDEARAGAPLIELLRHYWKQMKLPAVNPILVQKLDRETSGLLVMAKTAEAARRLQGQLAARKIKRVYRARVHGEMVEGAKGTWKSFLGRGKDGRKQSVSALRSRPGEKPRGAQEATTHYKVIEKRSGWTLLELELDTSRPHQLRIHCADAGHPVVGDRLYYSLAEEVLKRAADGKLKPPSQVHPHSEAARIVAIGETGKVFRTDVNAKRLCLHAVRLSFQHPFNQKRMLFESPVPF